jgi:hypothetical protein
VSRWRCADLQGALHLTADLGDAPVIVETTGPRGTNTTILDATSPTLHLAELLGPEEPLLSRLGAWIVSGAIHLLIGADHVLLVVGLVLLLGVTRRLVFALSAFTIGHSISLALGATGAVTLPAAPVEAAIALTLVALALTLTRPPVANAPASLLARAPMSVGLVVGLVHGLGFAGVLGELPLPASGLTLPIIGFNLGLELAQLGVVAIIAALLVVLRRLEAPLGLGINVLAGWAIGVIAAAWTIERLAS